MDVLVCRHGDANPPSRPAAAATAECISLMSRLQPELLEATALSPREPGELSHAQTEVERREGGGGGGGAGGERVAERRERGKEIERECHRERERE